MALKQSYIGKKIDKIRLIYSKDNLADAITKASLNLVLEKIIITNKAIIKLKKWVKQSSQKKKIACICLLYYLLIKFAVCDISIFFTFIIFYYFY